MFATQTGIGDLPRLSRIAVTERAALSEGTGLLG